MPNYSGTGAGGGGAGFHGKVIVTETADYVITVGSGGVSRAGFVGTAESGGASTLVTGGTTKLSAGGGNGGSSWVNGGSGGAGGNLVNNFTVVETTVSTNGNNGGGGTKVSNDGAPGPISGHTWGKSGGVYFGYAGGVVGSSCHGYVMIKYVGPLPDMYTFTINPTPSDATVTLTVDGNTYTQNSITVVSGKTVSWSVSKSGYETQTGSNTITEDTTLSIELEEQAAPLYYCYNNGAYYFYVKSTDTAINSTVYAMTPSFGKASTSSQLSDGLGKISSFSLGSLTIYFAITGSYQTATRSLNDDLYT